MKSFKKAVVFATILCTLLSSMVGCNKTNNIDTETTSAVTQEEITTQEAITENKEIESATDIESSSDIESGKESMDNGLSEYHSLHIERDSSTGNIYAIWAKKTFLLSDATHIEYLESTTCGEYAWIFNCRAQEITLYKLFASGQMEIYKNIYPDDVGFTEMTFAFASFIDENNGYLFFWRDDCYQAGWPIQFLKTLDGGNSWEMIKPENSVSAGAAKYYPEFAKFLTQNIGILTYRFEYGPSDCGITYVTSNGGKTWNSIYDLPYPDEIVRDNTYSKLIDAYWDEYDNSLRIEVKVISQFVEYTLNFKSYDFKEWVLY